MIYENHLDEVATLLTEIYSLDDQAAIKAVMQAQDNEFFCPHDDDPAICTQARAEQDARSIFEKYCAPQSVAPKPKPKSKGPAPKKH